MKVVYTKHAEDKLNRPDVKKFKINKRLIEKTLNVPIAEGKTPYGDYTAVSLLGKSHILRIIYDIIGRDRKVITFHVARKGRYEA